VWLLVVVFRIILCFLLLLFGCDDLPEVTGFDTRQQNEECQSGFGQVKASNITHQGHTAW
jgi:hypothetical protein